MPVHKKSHPVQDGFLWFGSTGSRLQILFGELGDSQTEEAKQAGLNFHFAVDLTIFEGIAHFDVVITLSEGFDNHFTYDTCLKYLLFGIHLINEFLWKDA